MTGNQTHESDASTQSVNVEFIRQLSALSSGTVTINDIEQDGAELLALADDKTGALDPHSFAILLEALQRLVVRIILSVPRGDKAETMLQIHLQCAAAYLEMAKDIAETERDARATADRE